MIKQHALVGIALALVVTSFTAGAQETPQQSQSPSIEIPPQEIRPKVFITRQTCEPVQIMMATIAKYQEEPLFQAKTLQQHSSGEWFEGSTMFFVNQNSRTYSMVTLYPDGIACMTAVGTEFEPYGGPMLYTNQ
jgi:hypothetical protein